MDKKKEAMKTFHFRAGLCETPDATVVLGPEDGDRTVTTVKITDNGGLWEFHSSPEGIEVACSGNWERLGLADALQFVVKVLRGQNE